MRKNPKKSPAQARAFAAFLAFFASLLALFGALGCTPRPEAAKETFAAMDTVMTLTVYGGGSDDLAAAKDRVLQLEARLSVTDPDSEIAALNRTGTAALSPDTAELLSRSLELCARTDGALDVTVYPVVRAWGFTTGDYTVPDEDTLAALLEKVDYTKVRLEGDTASLPAGAEIDLGAVAKGWTGDQLAILLREKGVESALLELGGNIHTIGSKPDGSDWRVAVRDPADGEGYLGVVSVSDKAVVTSGGYERYFERDGVRYWHIMDPATGAPARSGLASVTVVADSGLYADALSTALFVMGREAALDYWRANRDFEAILVSDDGSVTVTGGLEGAFTLSGERPLAVVRA